jgi:NADH-quinone oxidoreductase subunit G
MRKPEIACNTQVRDGMVVRTDSEKIQKLRKGVLEFLFLNHPLDCPICDKAGECKLQDYYLEHGQYVSRLEEGKVRKPKRLDIGKHIILDTERCVLCSRCVRFCDEISKTGELRIFERGSHSQIGIYPDRRLDNRYSLCTTDVCPVGALTSKDFRFSARVWYLERTHSVCGGCANGCNIEIHHYKGNIHRFMPRRNDAVNDTWMCDDGRLSYKDVQRGRLFKAVVRDRGAALEASWESALSRIAAGVAEVRAAHGPQAVGIVLSPQASNEENHLLASLARESGAQLFLVGGNPVGAPEGDDDGFLIRADKNPNSRGAQIIARHAGAGTPAGLVAALQSGSLKALFTLNNDVVGKAQQAGAPVELFRQLTLLVSVEPRPNATTELAHVVLPLATYVETDATWVNFAGRVQRLNRAFNPPGEVRGGWELVPAIATSLGTTMPARSPRLVFADLAAAVASFNGMSYDLLGDGGQSILEARSSAA